MRKLIFLLLALIFVSFISSSASAAVISLYDWGVNIDGASAFPLSGDPLPGNVDVSGFDTGTGLGVIDIGIIDMGSHFVGLFVDHDIDREENTYYNEFGSENGTAPKEQSWEIDEPGYVFGDIFDNFLAGTLDNKNGVPMGLEDDVSMAMGWDFILAAGETASISLFLSETLPSSGFYLSQTDPDSEVSFYFSSTLKIEPASTNQIPEPGTMMLVGTGLLGLSVLRRKRKFSISC